MSSNLVAVSLGKCVIGIILYIALSDEKFAGHDVPGRYVVTLWQPLPINIPSILMQDQFLNASTRIANEFNLRIHNQ